MNPQFREQIIQIAHKLDSKQGKLVYYTPTGEKYHFSKSCAGDNAMETTLNDAEGFLDPCGKCAY